MTDDQLDQYLALLTGMLRLDRHERDAIARELRDHVLSRLDEQAASGEVDHEAVCAALEEFGDAAGLAARFLAIAQVQKRRWIMRFTTMAVAGVFLATVVVWAMWPQPARFGGPGFSSAQDEVSQDTRAEDRTSRLSDSDLSLLNKLDELRTVEYDEIPFREVTKELAQILDVNLVIDGTVPETGLSDDTLITISLRDTRVATALELMLKPYDCTYAVKDGILILLSKDEAANPAYMVVRVFDCRDLIANLEPETRTQYVEVRGASDPVGTPQTQPVESIIEPGQRLVELVENTIAADSWESNGGSGTIKELDGVLVIQQTPFVIAQVAKLLDDLKSTLVETE